MVYTTFSSNFSLLHSLIDYERIFPGLSYRHLVRWSNHILFHVLNAVTCLDDLRPLPSRDHSFISNSAVTCLDDLRTLPSRDHSFISYSAVVCLDDLRPLISRAIHLTSYSDVTYLDDLRSLSSRGILLELTVYFLFRCNHK